MSEKKVFDLEPTSYEDGSYWVGVEEAGFHNYFIADNLDEFVTDAEQMMKAQELADARPSILSLPNLSDTSPILQELYLQIRNGQEDMGIVEKGNPLYTQENIDAMHKDIEKYHLRNVVEEQGDNILGFGDLLSQFRMSFDRMLKKQQATENAKDTELPALIDAGDWHLDPKETKRAFYSRWQQEQKVATVTKNGMTFKDMLLAACKQRLANGEKPSKLGKEMKEAMKSVQIFLGKENAR